MIAIARFFELALGLFFIASAASKAVNMEAFAVQISLYGVVKAPALVQLAAYATVSIETVLGALFLSGWYLRGLAYWGAGALTSVFTLLIAYAWRFKGLEDCGCFGEYVQMGPGMSILKNLVLLAILGGTGWLRRSDIVTAKPWVAKMRPALGAVCLALVAGIVLTSERGIQAAPPEPGSTAGTPAGPLAKFVFEDEAGTVDLGKGQHLAAMLSATCEHCMASVPGLNALHARDDLPDLTGVMMGSEKEIADFRMMTSPSFKTFGVPPLDFFEFIDSAPPRLLFAQDGAIVEAWEWKDTVPSAETVHAAAPAPAGE